MEFCKEIAYGSDDFSIPEIGGSMFFSETSKKFQKTATYIATAVITTDIAKFYLFIFYFCMISVPCQFVTCNGYSSESKDTNLLGRHAVTTGN